MCVQKGIKQALVSTWSSNTLVNHGRSSELAEFCIVEDESVLRMAMRHTNCSDLYATLPYGVCAEETAIQSPET